MNKLCFFNSVRSWGGGEKWHHDMAVGLFGLGYPVMMMTGKRSELRNRMQGSGVFIESFRTTNLSFLNPFRIIQLARSFRKHKVDILILNLPSDLKVAGLAARLSGVRRIIYRRGSAIPIRNTLLNRLIFKHLVDDIIANSEATARTILSQNPRLFDPDKIHIIYNGIQLQAFGQAGAQEKTREDNDALGKYGSEGTTKATDDTLGKAGAEETSRRNADDAFGLSGTKVSNKEADDTLGKAGAEETTQENNDALGKADAKEQAPGVVKTFVIGHAGRFVKQKGQSMLMEVASLLKAKGVRFKMLIAGEGRLEDFLREEVAQRDLLGEVTFTGFAEDIKAFMASIDVFVLPSLWEGFGYVMVEAMACGKPVVAFDLSSNPEIVARDETGFLIKPLDVEAMAAKLELLAADKALRINMGTAGRQRAQEYFSIEKTTDRLIQLLVT